MNGKIYIDSRIAIAEASTHEYTHFLDGYIASQETYQCVSVTVR